MENNMNDTYQEIIEKREESTRVYQLIDDLINESGFDLEMITKFCKLSIDFNEKAIKDYREKMLKVKDWIGKSNECSCIRIVGGGGNKWNTANCSIHSL